MKIKVFRDRPRPEAVRAIVYVRDVHLFVFHWGATVRWRREENAWRHVTAFWRPRPRMKGKGWMVSLGTWETENGVTERIPYSKRYVMLKVLYRGEG